MNSFRDRKRSGAGSSLLRSSGAFVGLIAAGSIGIGLLVGPSQSDPLSSKATPSVVNFSCEMTPPALTVFGPFAAAIFAQERAVADQIAAQISDIQDGTVVQIISLSASGEIQIAPPICFEDWSHLLGPFAPTEVRKLELRAQKDEKVRQAVEEFRTAAESHGREIGSLQEQLGMLVTAQKAASLKPGSVDLVLAVTSLGMPGRYASDDIDLPLRSITLVEPTKGAWADGEADRMLAWAEARSTQVFIYDAPGLDNCFANTAVVEKFIDTTDPMPPNQKMAFAAYMAATWDQAPPYSLRVNLHTIGGTQAESGKVFTACRGENQSSVELGDAAIEATEAEQEASATPWSAPRSAIVETVLGVIKGPRDAPLAGIGIASDFLVNDDIWAFKDNGTLDASTYRVSFEKITGEILPEDGILKDVPGHCLYLDSARTDLQTPAHSAAIEALFGCTLHTQ